MKGRADEIVTEEGFNAQLLEVLRSQEFRKACIQRLVAATIDAIDGFRVVELAVDRVREETRGPVSNLASRILRAVEAGCVDYAELRSLPYQKVVGPLIRGWDTLMSSATQAGLTEPEALKVIRDMLRKIPGSHWSRVKHVDRELIKVLKVSFTMFGVAKGCRPDHRQELSHASRRR